MYGGKILSRIFHAPDKWRGRLWFWNCSCVKALKGTALHRTVFKASCKRESYPYLRGTVPYRTVPKSRVNAELELMACDSCNQILSKSVSTTY